MLPTGDGTATEQWMATELNDPAITVTKARGAFRIELNSMLDSLPNATQPGVTWVTPATVHAACPAPSPGGIMGTARVDLASAPALPLPISDSSDPLPSGPLAPPLTFGGPVVCDPPLGTGQVVAADANYAATDLHWAVGGGYYAELRLDVLASGPSGKSGVLLGLGYAPVPGPGLTLPFVGGVANGNLDRLLWSNSPEDPMKVATTASGGEVSFAVQGRLTDATPGGTLPPLVVTITGTCPAWPGHGVP